MDYVKPHVDGLLQAVLPWTEDRWTLFLGLALAWVVGSVVFVFLLCFYNYYLHPIAHVKGPFLACISPVFLVKSVAGARLNPDIKALHRKYGPVVRVAPNELSFDTEQAIKDIHHPAPHVGRFTKRGTSEDLIRVLTFAEENLLTVDDGADHKRLRNVLAPAFTAKAMREQEAITQYHANKAVENLAKAADTPSRIVNLTYEINKMVWGNVGNLCFGEPVPFEHLDHHEASKHVYGKVAPYLEFFCYVNSFPVVKSITVAIVASARKLFGLSGNILGRAQLERHIAHQDGQKNFLTAILESKEAMGLSTGDIHSNMLLLLMGGYESSAVTLSALFYYLLNNREYYDRLKAEVRAQFSSVDDVDCTKVLQMPMLNACLNEALRLVPAFNGHSTHRVAATACVVDGVPVPAGVQVSADFYSVHRNPRYFALPDEFHPERWLPEGRDPASPFARDVLTASRPFAMGARVCIGREMSLHAMRLDVAKIVFATELTLANPEFVWDRDVSSHYMWYGHEVLVHVQKPGAA